MWHVSLKIWIVVALLALASGGWIAQAAGQGLMTGSWKLNLAKSNFGGGPKLMAMTVKVASDTPERIEYSVEQTTEAGFALSYSFQGPADGKEHPLTGSASLYSYTEEPGVVHETQKDSDGTVTKGDFTLGSNGKVGIWTYIVTNPDGTVVRSTLVFDRAA